MQQKWVKRDNLMKNIFTVIGLVIISLFTGLHLDAQYSAPITTSQFNNTYYVSTVPGFWPSIQSAVTQACINGNAIVSIPYGSTPTDNIASLSSGCATVIIEDKRSVPVVIYQ